MLVNLNNGRYWSFYFSVASNFLPGTRDSAALVFVREPINQTLKLQFFVFAALLGGVSLSPSSCSLSERWMEIQYHAFVGFFLRQIKNWIHIPRWCWFKLFSFSDKTKKLSSLRFWKPFVQSVPPQTHHTNALFSCSLSPSFAFRREKMIARRKIFLINYAWCCCASKVSKKSIIAKAPDHAKKENETKAVNLSNADGANWKHKYLVLHFKRAASGWIEKFLVNTHSTQSTRMRLHLRLAHSGSVVRRCAGIVEAFAALHNSARSDISIGN